MPTKVSTLSREGKTRSSGRAACATIAAARGWVLCCSMATNKGINPSGETPSAHVSSTTSGCPDVMVPVLSRKTCVTRGNTSMAAAFRIRICLRAVSPTITVRAVGVAKPNAQGQAITNTEMAQRIPQRHASSGSPKRSQRSNVKRDSPITTGTKIAAIRSAIRRIGGLSVCVWRTVSIIVPRMVSRPTEVASIVKAPSRLRVPAKTELPTTFSTGRGSPLINCSSTEVVPLSSTPSTGIASPARTRIRSPTFRVSTGTSVATPSRICNAHRGRLSTRAATASPVRCVARCSSHFPNKTKAGIITVASK